MNLSLKKLIFDIHLVHIFYDYVRSSSQKKTKFLYLTVRSLKLYVLSALMKMLPLTCVHFKYPLNLIQDY